MVVINIWLAGWFGWDGWLIGLAIGEGACMRPTESTDGATHTQGLECTTITF